MKWVDKIYIISLERHHERKAKIYADLQSAGFDVSKIEIINAVDGAKLNIEECVDTGIISKIFKDPGGLLTKSIYGCSVSHQLAYQRLLENPNAETALILEDDASLTHTGLRTMLPQSNAYIQFEKEKTNIDWEVIMLGYPSQRTDYVKTPTHVLKPMVRYPEGYAAHAYIINKSGADKLIRSNRPIQFAADVNIHCSDVNLYCVPTSYFSQKIGKFDRWTLSELGFNFNKYVLYNESDGTIDYQSSTTFGDFTEITDRSEYGTPDKTFNLSNVSKKLPVDYVNWNSFTAPNGDKIDGWANIHLKIKTNE
jgi:GR25 family glycosyltransferase involved in LPS biosynthesis